MKQIMNITTCDEDMTRYRDRKDLDRFYREYGLDGLEVLEAGQAPDSMLDADNVIGVHLRYQAAWMDFWTGNEARLSEEFGDRETWRAYYGGETREALIESYRKNIRFANSFQPEYLVFHVSECSLIESMKRTYHYSDEEVADAAICLLNQVTEEIKGTPWLLLENLWYPGLTMERPEIVKRLLKGIHYQKTGVMLDTGHLLHTNMELRTADEAVDYIHHILDRYEDLSFMKGIHLHQSLSGAYAKRLLTEWQSAKGTYSERSWAVMEHIFRIDTHKPFQSPRIREILDRIRPDYLVFEQISADREEHAAQLLEQRRILEWKGSDILRTK